jgi:hypothetical protein
MVSVLGSMLLVEIYSKTGVTWPTPSHPAPDQHQSFQLETKLRDRSLQSLRLSHSLHKLSCYRAPFVCPAAAHRPECAFVIYGCRCRWPAPRSTLHRSRTGLPSGVNLGRLECLGERGNGSFDFLGLHANNAYAAGKRRHGPDFFFIRGKIDWFRTFADAES